MLQSMGSQRAGHDLANEQQQQMAKTVNFMLRVFYVTSALHVHGFRVHRFDQP